MLHLGGPTASTIVVKDCTPPLLPRKNVSPANFGSGKKLERFWPDLNLNQFQVIHCSKPVNLGPVLASPNHWFASKIFSAPSVCRLFLNSSWASAFTPTREDLVLKWSTYSLFSAFKMGQNMISCDLPLIIDRFVNQKHASFAVLESPQKRRTRWYFGFKTTAKQTLLVCHFVRIQTLKLFRF